MYLALGQETCGSVGNNDERALGSVDALRFYLNTGNPAPCSGNITMWRVCYYGQSTVTNFMSYWATYAVYRRTSTGDSYERVSETFTAVQAPGTSLLTFDVVDGVIKKISLLATMIHWILHCRYRLEM